MRTITLFFILFSCLESFSQHEMSQWRGPNRNGVYPEKNLLTKWPDGGPKLLWKFEELGKGYSSAAVTSTRVYTAGSIDSSLYIFSFDLGGKLIWKNKLGPEWNKDFPGTRSTPLIYDELGYVTSGLGMLYCFETQTGTVKWKKDLFNELSGKNVQWGFTDNLIIDGNKLICTPGGNKDNVVALDRINGNIIWRSAGNGEPSAYSSPIIVQRNGKKFFVTMTAKSLISIDVETGLLAWKQNLVGDSHSNTPIYQDGFLCGWDGVGGAIIKISEDGKSTQEAWKNSRIRMPQGDGVLLNDNLFSYNQGQKKLFCFDWKTGNEKYFYPIDATILTIIAANDMLYCYSFNYGEVLLIKPNGSSFELMGKFTLPGNKKEHCAHPVIKDGRLYFRIDNILYAYSISNFYS
ncbi:MAG: PQQ-binding-like beta-propeller repeat protein [Tenuifilaceae bacterium]